MAHDKPFHRCFRPMLPGRNSGYSGWAFVVDHSYAKHPEHYTRAFFVIQKDIVNLFESIEPADINAVTYSFRIHGLFMRTCIEVEANFKAILKENNYNPVIKGGTNAGKPRLDHSWTIKDFFLVNRTHHLDGYSVEIPFWSGQGKHRNPFAEWKTGESLSWYKAYNACKHDRLENFTQANLGNLIDAYCGLFVLLSAQFGTHDFSPGEMGLSAGGSGYYSGDFGIGGFLMVEFPENWDDTEKYDFDWSILRNEEIKFQKINYDGFGPLP